MKNAIISLILVSTLFLSCNSESDGELEIKALKPPIKGYSMQPYLFSSGSELFMSWTEKENDSLFVLYMSKYENDTWSVRSEIKRGSDWFVNWADFPAIASNKNNLISYYLKKSDKETFSYDIFLRMSDDDGKNWPVESKLHNDETKSEHGFVSIIPSTKDSFFVSWLDGRNTKSSGHDHSHEGNGAMQIRSAEVLMDGKIGNEYTLDARTCDCCQTSMAMTNDGPVVVFRDRSDEEVRDIYISKFKEGKWLKSSAVFNDYWKINGCPVNGPKIAAIENNVATAWFTAADNIPKVKVSFSFDGGLNFDKPFQIDHGKPIGRVDLCMINRTTALVSWMESTKEEAELRVAKLNADGEIGNSMVVGVLSASRSTGFPQMEAIGNTVYFAWNESLNESSSIKVVSLSLDELN